MHSEHTVQLIEGDVGVGKACQVADEDDLLQFLLPCGEDGQHTDGLVDHVKDAQGDILAGGQVGDLAEVCRGGVVGQNGVDGGFGNIVDPQVDLGEISLFCQNGDLLGVGHSQKFFGKPHESAAAYAGTAQVFTALRIRIDVSRAGTHADDDGTIQPGKVQAALCVGGEFLHADGF